MKLYIARHGLAEARAETDADRALTARGRAEMERLALFLGTCGIEVPEFYHSGYRRARETAEILGRSVSSTLRVEPIDGFTPDDPVEGIEARVRTWTDDTFLVGHLPLVSRLVSRLVLDGTRTCVAFDPGTVVGLECVGERWAIEVVVRPSLLGPPPGM